MASYLFVEIASQTFGLVTEKCMHFPRFDPVVVLIVSYSSDRILAYFNFCPGGED